jgi:simple sugar transport system ATP-binding protein
MLVADQITKSYPGVVANHEVSIDLYAGEIHAVLGENGAGKTTLMAIIYGLARPDSGEVRLDGTPLALHSPKDALSHGIGFVQQHFSLIPTLTVAQNMVLSLSNSGEKVSVGEGTERVRALSARYGLDVPPEALVSSLSVGLQQRAELLKALARNARVLILDEPTSVLTPQESAELSDLLTRLAADGVGIFLISHKLEEVLRIADRISVLRRGRMIGTVAAKTATQRSLAEMMVGELSDAPVVSAGHRPRSETPRLVVENLSVRSESKRGEVHDVSLELFPGEVLGIAGVEGSGQVEMLEAMAGVRQVTHGRIRLDGDDISSLTVRQRQRRGIAHIAADRHAAGFVASLSVADNLVVPVAGDRRFSQGGILRRGAIRDFVKQAIEDFDIRVAGPDVEAGTLSGGNQQRVVIAREFSRQPSVVLSCFATRGLDFASIVAVHERVRAMRDAGAAVAYASVDLDELIALSDRILVLYQGRVAGIVDAEGATSERLGLLMGGSVLT